MSKQKDQTPPVRPLCLELEDAKAEIIAVINMAHKKHNIPFFLLESVIVDAGRQVSSFAKTEREAAARDYEDKLAEFNKERRGDNE